MFLNKKIIRKIVFGISMIFLTALIAGFISRWLAPQKDMDNYSFIAGESEFYAINEKGEIVLGEKVITPKSLGIEEAAFVLVEKSDNNIWAATDKGEVYDVQENGASLIKRFSGDIISVSSSSDGKRLSVLTQNRSKNRVFLMDMERGTSKTVNLDSVGKSMLLEEKGEETVVHVIKSDVGIFSIDFDGTIHNTLNLRYIPVDCILANDSLFVFCEGGVLYEVDAEKYVVKKEYEIGSDYDTMSYDEENHIFYFTSYDSKVLQFDMTREKAKTFDVTYEIIQSVFLKDGNLIVRNINGKSTAYGNEYFAMQNAANILIKIGIIGFLLFIAMYLIIRVRTIEKERIRFGLLKKTIVKYRFPICVLVPAIALVGFFCYYPAINGFVIAFTDYKPGVYQRFVGIQNFIDLLDSERYWYGFRNLVILLGAGLLKAIIPPLIIAFLIFAIRSKKIQYVSRTLLYLPGILPGVAGMLLWKEGIFGRNGLLNALFGLADYNWLADTEHVILYLILVGFPWVGSFLIFFGALQGIPNDYREAAQIEGCGTLKRIFTIDIPLIVPQLKYVLLMSFISGVQEFNLIYVMLGSDPEITSYVPMLEIYNQISYGNFGLASAMGVVMFLVVLVPSYILFNARRKENGL